MKEPRRVGQPLIMIAILLLIAFQGISVSSGTQQNQVTLSTPESIKTEFDSVPCKDEDRLNAVQTLFERMGAAPSEISLEKHKNVVNVVVRKQGSSPEIIVIGAHYE